MNWYKCSQYDDRLVNSIIIWLQQAETGNIQIDSVIEDIETIVGYPMDVSVVNSSISNAIELMEKYQKRYLTPNQLSIIDGIREYIVNNFMNNNSTNNIYEDNNTVETPQEELL